MMAHRPDRPLKLAYASPLNPIASGLSDYSEALLPAWADRAQLVLYSACGRPSNPWLADHFEVRPIETLAEHRAEHELSVYQIGNSTQHQAALNQLRRRPGIVTLHEPFLHTGVRAMSTAEYARALGYELGATAHTVRRLCENESDRRRLLAWPLIGRVIDVALGLVVHSQIARRVIEDYWAARPALWARFMFKSEISVIPQVMPLIDAPGPGSLRAELGIEPVAPVYGVAGMAHPTKETELILQAFARVTAAIPTAVLIFAGELSAEGPSLPALARELGLADRVRFLGRIEPLEELNRVMGVCDIHLNLRHPTIGETSNTALRTLAIGRALIVREVGWYGELPPNMCVKLPATGGVEALASLMLQLGRSSEQREALAAAGRRYIAAECQPATAAARYDEYCRTVLERIAGAGRPAGPVAAAPPTAERAIALPPGAIDPVEFQAEIQRAAEQALQHDRLKVSYWPSVFALKPR